MRSIEATARCRVSFRLAAALDASRRASRYAAPGDATPYARGHVALLGQTWPAQQGTARFHLDPATGNSWPHDTYCFDIDYRHDRSLGDIKYVWEFNRLQYLQPVAALAAHDRDDELADFCLAEIESWIDANPPFLGVNWASGIELALRLVSILVVLGLIGTEVFSPRIRRKIRACLAAHAYWLARYPSRHSSANNHTIAEAGALFLLGTLSPELGSGGVTETARALLIDQVERQIHATASAPSSRPATPPSRSNGICSASRLRSAPAAPSRQRHQSASLPLANISAPSPTRADISRASATTTRAA